MNYDQFGKALERLERQFANFQAARDRAELTPLDREAIAESVIQRFETCYDTCWKDLKRHLVEVLGLPDVPNSPKPILRLAGQNKLLPSPVEQWLLYADARIKTAHDYSGDKAAEVLDLVQYFLRDARAVYVAMSGEVWK